MEQISEEEAKRLLEEGKEEIKKILNEGGKITDTIIREKDKATTIRKIELANGKSNSFKIIQNKDEIKIDNATRYIKSKGGKEMENEVKNEITLLSVEDIEKITGWARATVMKVMSRPDFPVLKIGKENQVLVDAFKEYLMERRDLRGDK